ncbi:MAG: DUF4179 domain-containing protein [Lachnospiraceae bacterium]|nr:DUF4179 domain-containing protein [Lachnospiraceae bacterium]
MNMYEIMEALREDIEVPDIVQRKADEALEQIRKTCAKKQDVDGKGRKMSRKGRKRLVVCIAAAILVIGGTCIAAAYQGISRSTEKVMKISEQQKAELESQAAAKESVKMETGESEEVKQEKDALVTFPNVSATDKGVTITLQDCIVDNYSVRMSLRIDGYQLPEVPEGAEFCSPELIFGLETGDDVMNHVGGVMSSGFYNGDYTDEFGKYVKDEAVKNCQFADGSMEYNIRIDCDTKGAYLNQPMRLEIAGFGYSTEKAGDLYTDLEGNWVLEWTLEGADEIYEADIEDGAVGDTGATLTHVELSPVSLRVLIDFPRQEYEEELEGGGTHTTWEMPPHPCGVKLADGTSHYFVWTGGGSARYVETDVCEIISGGSRILDVEQVEYILFMKDYPEDGKFTDDDFYFVKIR